MAIITEPISPPHCDMVLKWMRLVMCTTEKRPTIMAATNTVYGKAPRPASSCRTSRLKTALHSIITSSGHIPAQRPSDKNHR